MAHAVSVIGKCTSIDHLVFENGGKKDDVHMLASVVVGKVRSNG